MDVIAGLMQKDLEVTHDGIGPLPALPHTTRSRDLDPAFTCCPHTMVDVNAKRKLGYVVRGLSTLIVIARYMYKPIFYMEDIYLNKLLLMGEKISAKSFTEHTSLSLSRQVYSTMLAVYMLAYNRDYTHYYKWVHYSVTYSDHVIAFKAQYC